MINVSNPNDIEFEKIQKGSVLHYPSFMKKRGYNICCACRVLFTNKINGESKECDVVIVDDRFYELFKETREILISHELGHIYNGHLNSFLFKRNSIITRIIYRIWCIIGTPRYEKEADEYAAIRYGVSEVIHALDDLQSICSDITKYQLIRRKKIIKKL